MSELNPFRARTFLHPEGILASAEVIIVGDCPSYQDIREHKQLSGATSSVVTELFSAVGLNRSTCYITTVIKDLDKSLKARFDFKDKVFYPEGQTYISVLKQELELANGPNEFIIAFGEMALEALTSRKGITNWRGSVVESTLLPGKWVIPILHPQTVVPPLCQHLNKPLIQFDLERAVRIIKARTYVPYAYTAKIEPTYQEVITYLSSITESDLVAFDIEIFNEEVSCISLSNSPTYSMSIPFCTNYEDYFLPEEETEIWLQIAKILSNPKIAKIAQNTTFDAHFLLRRYGICCENLHDTMIAQQIIAPDFKKDLGFITSMHTDLPYHKEEGKRFFKVGGVWQQLWNYNALDSLVCRIALPRQLEILEQQGNLAAYNRQRAIIPALVYMQEHGIKIDLDGVLTASAIIKNQVEALKLNLNELAGQELNPNSPKQLSDYFYRLKKFPAYRNQGSVTTDDLAMKRLIRKGSKEAKLVLEIRKLIKINSTYLAEKKFDLDKRLRCAFNPAGTRFSRISSKENIFETGMNL